MSPQPQPIVIAGRLPAAVPSGENRQPVDLPGVPAQLAARCAALSARPLLGPDAIGAARYHDRALGCRCQR